MSAPFNVYTVTWCPHCIRCLEFLDREGIAYRNFDVETDDAVWHRALALTHQVDIVPVVETGGEAKWGAFNADFEQWLRERARRDQPRRR